MVACLWISQLKHSLNMMYYQSFLCTDTTTRHIVLTTSTGNSTQNPHSRCLMAPRSPLLSTIRRSVLYPFHSLIYFFSLIFGKTTVSMYSLHQVLRSIVAEWLASLAFIATHHISQHYHICRFDSQQVAMLWVYPNKTLTI